VIDHGDQLQVPTGTERDDAVRRSPSRMDAARRGDEAVILKERLPGRVEVVHGIRDVVDLEAHAFGRLR
jgi:hypothetical protein